MPCRAAQSPKSRKTIFPDAAHARSRGWSLRTCSAAVSVPDVNSTTALNFSSSASSSGEASSPSTRSRSGFMASRLSTTGPAGSIGQQRQAVLFQRTAPDRSLLQQDIIDPRCARRTPIAFDAEPDAFVVRPRGELQFQCLPAVLGPSFRDPGQREVALGILEMNPQSETLAGAGPSGSWLAGGSDVSARSRADRRSPPKDPCLRRTPGEPNDGPCRPRFPSSVNPPLHGVPADASSKDGSGARLRV